MDTESFESSLEIIRDPIMIRTHCRFRCRHDRVKKGFENDYLGGSFQGKWQQGENGNRKFG